MKRKLIKLRIKNSKFKISRSRLPLLGRGLGRDFFYLSPLGEPEGPKKKYNE
jgi:hypothetical protein